MYIPDENLVVGGIHLAGRNTPKLRSKQFRNLSEFFGRYGEIRQVLMGDFNITPEEAAKEIDDFQDFSYATAYTFPVWRCMGRIT